MRIVISASFHTYNIIFLINSHIGSILDGETAREFQGILFKQIYW